MTEMQNAMDLEQQVPELSNMGTSESQVPEKTIQLTQSKLDEIIKHEKRRAEEKGRQSAMTSLGGVAQGPSHDEIIEKATHAALEKLRKENQEHQQKQAEAFYQKRGEEILSDITSKIDASKDRLPGIETAIDDLNMGAAPNIMLLMNEHDNMPDMLHEMKNNPSKLAIIHHMFNTFGPNVARKELQKLSSSLKANEAAAHVKTANEPLSQITPSNSGADSGSKTISDLRKQRYLRG